jgi:PAS domain S-box-containing protein
VQIAVMVAGLTLILSIILAVVAGQISGAQLEQNIGGNLSQLSTLTVSQIDQTMFERWREIRNLAAQSNLFRSANNAAAVRVLFNQIKQTYRYYSWIGWTDSNGNVIAGTDGLLEGQNVADKNWFLQAKAAPMPYFGDVHQAPPLFITQPNTSDGPLRFIDVAVAIRSPDGDFYGTIGVYLDWRFMWENAQTFKLEFAQQMGYSLSEINNVFDVFILGADGSVLLGSSAYSAPDIAPLPKLNLPDFQAVSSKQSGYFTATWPDTGTQYLTGYAKDTGYKNYPGLGWNVLVRERADVALASIPRLQALLLGIGVVCALFFSVLGWFIAIRVTHPLVKVARRAQEIQLAEAHNERVSPSLHADEVSVLSNTIDRLLHSLDTRNIQLTELNANLEQMVQARTAELTASQRFNEKMLGTAPDMVYIYDTQRHCTTYINQAVQSILGYRGDQFLSTPTDLFTQIVHPDDLDSFHHHRRALMMAVEGDMSEHACRLRHRDGRWVWIELRETVFTRSGSEVTQIFGIAQDITIRKQAEAQMQEEAASHERQRLARDLHDSVSQTLFSATILTQTLPLLWEKGEVVIKQNLGELSRLTRGALAEMRTLLNELRSNAIETANLDELLQELMDAARGRTQAECLLTLDGDNPLPTEVKIALYRVTQEALNNATKHARANKIEVVLIRTDSQADLQIRDDGRGFTPDYTSSTHFGLGIMSERAEEAGATLDIQSTPKQGTQVHFHWQAQQPPKPDSAEPLALPSTINTQG